MRLARLTLALVLPVALVACERQTVDLPSESDLRETPGMPNGADHPAANRAALPEQQALESDPYSVVPGVRIGRVRVGMPFDSVLVTLGRPDVSDVGTDQLRASWRGEGQAEGTWVDVFALVNEQVGGYVVAQVNASGVPFQTPGGVRASATRREAARLYEGMRPSGPRRFYDSSRGIGFEYAEDGYDARALQVFVVPPGTRDGALAPPVAH